MLHHCCLNYWSSNPDANAQLDRQGNYRQASPEMPFRLREPVPDLSITGV
jgi:hypothetical protein